MYHIINTVAYMYFICLLWEWSYTYTDYIEAVREKETYI